MRALLTLGVVLLTGLTALAGDLEVEFEKVGKYEAILVEVKVSGEPRTFLLDTGAARTVVSPEVAGVTKMELKLARFRSSGPGIAGEATWARVSSFRLGDKRWYDRTVVVMDLKKVSEVYGRKIDGLLGQDILLEFDRVTFDFKNHKLVLSD